MLWAAQPGNCTQLYYIEAQNCMFFVLLHQAIVHHRHALWKNWTWRLKDLFYIYSIFKVWYFWRKTTAVSIVVCIAQPRLLVTSLERDLIWITSKPSPRKAELLYSHLSITVIGSISIAITITLAICGGALYTLHYILSLSCSLSNQSSNTSCNSCKSEGFNIQCSMFCSILASSSAAPSQAFEGVWASRLKRGVICWSLL